jgi:hypothetical protein
MADFFTIVENEILSPFDEKEYLSDDDEKSDYSLNSSISSEEEEPAKEDSKNLSLRKSPPKQKIVKGIKIPTNEEIEESISNYFGRSPVFYPTLTVGFDTKDLEKTNRNSQQILHKNLTFLRNKNWDLISKDIVKKLKYPAPLAQDLLDTLNLFLLSSEKRLHERIQEKAKKKELQKKLQLETTFKASREASEEPKQSLGSPSSQKTRFPQSQKQKPEKRKKSSKMAYSSTLALKPPHSPKTKKTRTESLGCRLAKSQTSIKAPKKGQHHQNYQQQSHTPNSSISTKKSTILGIGSIVKHIASARHPRQQSSRSVSGFKLPSLHASVLDPNPSQYVYHHIQAKIPQIHNNAPQISPFRYFLIRDPITLASEETERLGAASVLDPDAKPVPYVLNQIYQKPLFQIWKKIGDDIPMPK